MRKFLLLLCCAAVVAGCVRGLYDDGGDKAPPKISSVDEARNYFEKQHTTAIALPEMLNERAQNSTRSEGGTSAPRITLIPNWSEAAHYRVENMDVVDVPLHPSSEFSVWCWDSLPNGTIKHYDLHHIDARLTMVEKPETGVRIFTTAMLPSWRGLFNWATETRFAHPDNDFSGALMISELDGREIQTMNYLDGKLLQDIDTRTPPVGDGPSGVYDPNCYWCQIGHCAKHKTQTIDKVVVPGTYPRDTIILPPYFPIIPMLPPIGNNGGNYNPFGCGCGGRNCNRDWCVLDNPLNNSQKDEPKSHFEEPQNEYNVSVTASPEAGGQVFGGGTYETASTAYVSAHPKAGWKFAKWTGHTTTQNSFGVTVTRNLSYTAHFVPEDLKISLSAPSAVPLGQDFPIIVKISHMGVPVQSVKIYYTRSATETPDASTTIYEGTNKSYMRKAIMPGYWHAHADVTIDGKTYHTNVVEVLEEFPDSSTILAAVSSEFDNLWTKTKDYAIANKGAHLVREYGAWVMLNTQTGEYSVEGEDGGKYIEGAPIALVPGGPGKASVLMTMPRDNWNNLPSIPNIGGKFVVAHFHTHFPICYAAVDPGVKIYRDPCGPTNPEDYTAVNGSGVPGFVYDYTGKIDHRHNINAPSHAYPYGSYNKRDAKIFKF